MAILIMANETIEVIDRNVTGKRWFNGIKMFYTVKVLPVLDTSSCRPLQVNVKERIKAKAVFGLS